MNVNLASVHFAEGVDYAELDAKKPEELTEEEKIALLGRPRLGDVTKIQIRIRESKEFKVKVLKPRWIEEKESQCASQSAPILKQNRVTFFLLKCSCFAELC